MPRAWDECTPPSKGPPWSASETSTESPLVVHHATPIRFTLLQNPKSMRYLRASFARRAASREWSFEGVGRCQLGSCGRARPILRRVGSILAPCPVAPRRWPAGGRHLGGGGGVPARGFSTRAARPTFPLGSQQRSGSGLEQAAGVSSASRLVCVSSRLRLGGSPWRRL